MPSHLSLLKYFNIHKTVQTDTQTFYILRIDVGTQIMGTWVKFSFFVLEEKHFEDCLALSKIVQFLMR